MNQPTITQLADALDMSTMQLGLYANQHDTATLSMVEAHKKLVADVRGETYPPMTITTPTALPSLRMATVKLSNLSEATMRECYLAHKRSTVGLVAEEATELMELQRATQLREEAAAAKAEEVSEGRLQRPVRINPHD